MAIVHAAVIAVDDDDVRTVFNPAPIVDAVVGPDSATDGHIAVFSGSTGKIIADGGAPGGGGLLQSATITLTDSQIKSLPTTAVEIVPGIANTLLIPTLWIARIVPVADYTNINAACSIFITRRSNDQASSPISETLGSVSELLASGFTDPLMAIGGTIEKTFLSAAPGIGTVLAQGGIYDSDALGNGLSIKASNSSDGDFEDGDAGNVLNVIVYYVVVDVS